MECPARGTVICNRNVYPSQYLSLIHISEPTRPRLISYAVFCLKKKTYFLHIFDPPSPDKLLCSGVGFFHPIDVNHAVLLQRTR